MAGNIANFINQHNLDGVDFDWEYPAVSRDTSVLLIRLEPGGDLLYEGT